MVTLTDLRTLNLSKQAWDRHLRCNCGNKAHIEEEVVDFGMVKLLRIRCKCGRTVYHAVNPIDIDAAYKALSKAVTKFNDLVIHKAV